MKSLLANMPIQTAFFGIAVFLLGISCFLLGLYLMRWALQNIVGERTKKILTTMTQSPFTGVVTGILLATLLQSSSIVLIIVINLVNMGALPLLNGVAIVLGANLGTSLTLEFIAFSDPLWIIILLALSVLLLIIRKPAYSIATLSLTLVLGGFWLFKQNAFLLTTMPLNLEQISHWQGHLLTLIGGVVFTAIIQSSTAATAFTMTLVDENIISLLSGVLIVYGSNVGTCSTAVLAALGASLQAKKIMLYHVFINILCVLILLPITPMIVAFLSRVTSDGMQQVAHAQVLFNILTIVFFYPFIRQHVRMFDRIFK